MSVSEESEYFFRISMLLLDTGGKTFRKKIQSLPSFTTFEEFLSSAKHVLYHLWRPSPCKCPPQPLACTSRQPCKYSEKQRHLHKTQWDSLFRLQTGVCSCRNVHECTCLDTEEEYCVCAQSLGCSCVYHPIPGVDVKDLDLTLTGTILRNSDLLLKEEKEMVKKIMDLRNEVYGHLQKAALNILSFNKYWSQLSDEIQKLANKCNDPSFYTEILSEISKIKGTVLDDSNTKRILLIWKEFSFLTKMITDEQKEIRDEQKQLNRIINKQLTALRKEQLSLHEKYQDISFAVKEIGDTMVTKSDVKGIKTDKKRPRHKSEEICITGVVRNLISSTSLVLEKQKKNIYTRQSYVFEEAKDRLNAAKVLVLSGVGGRGKTSMAHEIMLEVTKIKCSYSPVILNEPTQWDETVDGNKPLVIFIDDIFGKTNLDEKYLSAWEKRFDAMWACASEGKVLLIIGCRSNILEEGKSTLEKYDLFKGEHILNLSSSRYELEFDDKIEILTKYCEKFGIEIVDEDSKEEDSKRVLTDSELYQIASRKTLVGFPQLCNLFFNNSSFFEKGKDFFIHASDELVKDISSLRRNMSGAYAILLYVVLRGNSIAMEDLNVNLMNDICITLKISPLDETDIQDLIDEQPLNTYLEESPFIKSSYHFKHITIQEAVLKSVSKTYPEFLLNNADPQILVDYIRSSNHFHSSGDISVNISAKLHGLLAKRLLCEKNNDIHLIVWHPSLVDPHFASTVVSTLYECQTIQEVFLSCCEAGVVSLPSAIVESEIRRCKLFNTERISFLSLKALQRGICFSLSKNYSALFEKSLELCNILSLDLDSLIYFTLTVDSMVISMYTSIGLIACVLAREQEVKFLISDTNINTDIVDLFGNSMLHYAASNNWYEIVTLLLQKSKSRINHVNNMGETPILVAAKVSENQNIILHLIEHDSNVSIRDKDGHSIVHYAARKDWIDVIKQVQMKNLQILSQKDNEGNSPIIALMKTPILYMNDTFQLLLLLSDVSCLRDRDGNNILHYLTRVKLANCNALEFIGKLFEKDKSLLNQANDKGETPLIYAAKHHARCSLLIIMINDFPTDLCVSDVEGNTVLHFLAFNGLIDLICLVLQKNSRLTDIRNKKGQSPILFAYTNFNLESMVSMELLETFLKHGVDLKICDNDKNGILHYVALWASYKDTSRYTTIERLLSHDKHLIFMRNSFQQIPFVHSVCSQSIPANNHFKSTISIKMLNMLVSDDLYLEDSDKIGNTLLHYICRFGIITMEMKALPQMRIRNNFGMDAILYAACYGKIEELTLTANLSDEVCIAVDHFGRSILHYCALNFWANAVRLILQNYKYRKNLEDRAGDTPLMFALKYGKIADDILVPTKVCDTISTLLKYEETVNPNRDNNTVLHLYAAKIPYISEKIMELATEADPDCLSRKNSQGLTPFMVYQKTQSERYWFYFTAETLIPKDLCISDNDGNSVGHYCVLHELPSTVEIIKSGCTKVLDKRNINGETPLVYAAKEGKGMFVIPYLLETGDLRQADLNGNTLLHYCLLNGWTYIAEQIVTLDKGLLNYQNNIGQTPLSFTLASSSETEEEAIEKANAILQMLDFTPNLRLRDFLGNTLLHYSALRCYIPLVRSILEKDSGLIKLLNNKRQSPTMFMMDNAKFHWEKAKPILNLFLKYDHRLEQKDRKGISLVQYCSNSVVQTYIMFSGCLTK